MIELYRVFLSLLTFTLMDYELSFKVRHELHVFLLLVSSDDFEFVVEQKFELFVKSEGKREPAHVRGFAALPKVNDAVEIVAFGRGLAAVAVVVDGRPIATQEDVAVHGVEMTWKTITENK